MELFTTERELLGHSIGGAKPFFVIAGPCVIESEDLVFRIVDKLKTLSEALGLLVVFKASFDKANRSSLSSFRGPGLREGLRILSRVKSEWHMPVLTDIHSEDQVGPAAEVVDILQIPAFLSRQTDLIVTAAHSGKVVNIKKGQFMAPDDVVHVVNKVYSSGNNQCLITERGYTFGYHNLVVDPRSFEIMRRDDIPVIFDATHSVQMPGGGQTSGGAREFIPVQSRAAVASGLEGIFFEVHPEPEKGLSDASNMFYLDKLEGILSKLLAIDAVVKGRSF